MPHTFLITYSHNNSLYSLEIPADSLEDAISKLNSLKSNGYITGTLLAKLKVPSPSPNSLLFLLHKLKSILRFPNSLKSSASIPPQKLAQRKSKKNKY